MAIADDFKALLNIGKQLVSDPAVRQAISDDIATVEAKAEQGIESLEQHVASWFAAHYALPAPAQDGAGAVAPEPVPAPGPQQAETAAQDAGAAAPDAGDARVSAPADGTPGF